MELTGTISDNKLTGTIGNTQSITATMDWVYYDCYVKVSSTDTTQDYLLNKLVAGTGITLTKNNTGSNETITIGTDLDGTFVNQTGDTMTGALAIEYSGIKTNRTNNNLEFYRAGTSYIDQAGIGGDLRFRTSNAASLDTTALTILSNGKIGIGTSSPVGKLTIDNGVTDGGLANIRIRSGTIRYRGDIYMKETDGMRINSYDDTGAVYLPISIDASKTVLGMQGNIGIGTSSPNNLLDVFTGINDTKGIRITRNLGVAEFEIKTTAGDFTFDTTSSSSNYKFQIAGSSKIVFTSAGQVGIGTTSPSHMLEVVGTLSFPQTGWAIRGASTDNAVLYISDTSTVLSTTGSGDIYFQIGGTNLMKIEGSSGNVGIGTTSPNAPLHISADTGAADEIAQFENINATGQIRVALYRASDSGTGVNKGGVLFGADYVLGFADYEARRIAFYTGTAVGSATERLAIASNGKVGIGTSSPAKNLHVKDATVDSDVSIRIANDSTGYDFAIMGSDSDKLYIGEAGAGDIVLQTNGNVGIGTASPSQKLVVGNDIGYITGNNAIVIGDTAGQLIYGTDVNNRGYIKWYGGTGEKYLTISTVNGGTGYADTLTIRDGNVGIGTTNSIITADGVSAAKLHIVTSSSFPLSLEGSGSYAGFDVNGIGASSIPFIQLNRGTNRIFSITAETDNDTINFRGGNAAATEILTLIKSSGKVGIGTSSPSQKLEIDASDGALRVQTTTDGGLLASFGGEGDIRVDAPGVEGGRFIIKDRGLVGINAAAPNSLLQVNGSFATKRVASGAADVSTADEVIIGVNDTTAARTVTLLTADCVEGRIIIVKDESGGAGTNNITIATEGTETIDGASTQVINTNYGVIRLYSDGSNWFMI